MKIKNTKKNFIKIKKRIRKTKSKKGGDNSKKSFSEIIKKYESGGTNKGTVHSYTEEYDKIFTPYRDKNINLLEIGLYGGSELLAFNEYFKNATIHGIDITSEHLLKHLNLNEYKNIHIHIGDAASADTINHFNTMYDIIIEDASHELGSQIKHFDDYNKFVKNGGVYIIEDVDGKNLEELKTKTTEIANKNNFTVEVVDLRKVKNRYDDILIVFRKK